MVKTQGLGYWNTFAVQGMCSTSGQVLNYSAHKIGLYFLQGKTAMSVLKTFKIKAIAEITKAAAISVVAVAVPGSQALTSLAGGVSKELVEALLAKTTEVERKLDKLLREPLIAGLRHLKDAGRNLTNTPEETASRDSLLDDAHVFFSRAIALAGDSREDSLFIQALDCIALAERTGRISVAVESLQEVTAELEEVHRRVSALQTEANEWMEHVEALNKFLGRDNYRAKPFGYDAQIGLAKEQEWRAKRAKDAAESATARVELLKKLVAVAKASVESHKKR